MLRNCLSTTILCDVPASFFRRKSYLDIYRFVNNEYEIQFYEGNADKEVYICPSYQSSYGYLQPISSGHMREAANPVNG